MRSFALQTFFADSPDRFVGVDYVVDIAVGIAVDN